jgi:hypothetical protein
MTLLSIQPFSLLCTITPDGSFSLMAVFLLNIIIGGNFLDISVNKTFKAELRKLWESWMCHREKSFTNTSRMRRASYQIVVQWVKDAWNTIPDRIIISGFIKAEILDMPEQ